MSGGDQNYKEACSHYEKGNLEEAIKLFSRAIDSFFRSSEREKEAKAYYYRGCTYYRLGIQCEKNQMFEDSKEKFDKVLDDFEEFSKKIKELCSKKINETKQEFDSALNKFNIFSEKINEHKEIKTDLDDALKDVKEVSEKINDLFPNKLNEIKQELKNALKKFNKLFEKINEYQEIKTDFDNALNDIKEISKKTDELFFFNYYAGCAYYKLGLLCGKKRMNEDSKKSFESAITSLENASNHCSDKENGKLWFYKGVAEYEVNTDDGSKKISECIKNLKEAVTYDYYDIEIFRELLPEDLIPGYSQENNSMNLFLLYYLKRYLDIIKRYSTDDFHKECLGNLIKDYGYEGAYYCALSHYEFKDFKRSFEIFNKLIRLNEIVKNYESFKNQIEDSSIINELNQIETDISNFEETIKRIDLDSFDVTNFNDIDEYCNKLINNFAKLKAKENAVLDTIKEYFSHELLELIDDIKVFRKEIENIRKTNDVKPYANFLKKIIPNSWYYKGLILYELRNNFKDQKLLKAVFDGFEIVTVEDNDKKEFKEQYKNFVNNKDDKNLKECMLRDVGKKKKFVKYLNDPSNNGPKAGEILQKIFDIESQIAFEKALEEYNKIIESSQTFGLYYDKALVLDELKRYKEAIESLDEFLKNKPRDAKAWLKKGTILFKIAKDEAIETTSEESKKENKKEKSSCEEEITGIEAAKNALEKSIQYFKILIDENPKNPDHWYNKGTAHSSLAEVLIKTRDYKGSLNEYEETIKAFDNATDLNPIFALAWNNKGNAYLKLKKYNKAIEAFEKAFEINPNYYLALHNKGDALYSLGKYEEAIEIYNQVIKKDKDTNEERQSDPNVYKSCNDKGLAYYKLERYDEAVKAFNEAIEINPTFADGRTNKGVVFYKLEMFSEAKKAFEGALKIDPGNVRASNNLGIVLAINGELDQAKKLFENTLQENPDFIYGHINLAELFLNNGGIKRASEEIERTLNIVKGSEDTDIDLDYIYYLDGRIKIEAQSKDKQAQTEDKQIQSKDISGKYSEAVKSFEKALSFNVENPRLILWSVYVKYLCQKFETYGKTNSSEEPKPGKENFSPKVEDISSNEFSNSIVSDLEKVLNFCSLSKMKKHASYQQITQSWWFKILLLIPVLIVIVAISILDFFGFVEFSIKSLFVTTPITEVTGIYQNSGEIVIPIS